MPEGPSIMHLKDQLMPFKNKIVKQAGGYGDMPTDWIKGKKVLNISTWGKHLLITFTNGTVRIHLGLFGSILINERRKVNRKFFLEFADGEINGYVVNAKKLDGKPEDEYDWRTDIMSKDFDKTYMKKLIKEQGKKTIDDVLMNQDVFAGVGNKIRNEALYRAGIHPLSLVEKIPAPKITKLIDGVLAYAQIFYKQLTKDGVNDKFQVYNQDFDPDGGEVTMKVLKKTKRKIYFSEHRQKLYK